MIIPSWLSVGLKIAPWAIAAGAIGWGFIERGDAQEARLATLTEKNAQLQEANEAWQDVKDAQKEFRSAVAEGYQTLQNKITDLEYAQNEFTKRVAADANSKILLTDSERAALRLLMAQPVTTRK